MLIEVEMLAMTQMIPKPIFLRWDVEQQMAMTLTDSVNLKTVEGTSVL